jgi:Mitochondrial calcium uniporter
MYKTITSYALIKLNWDIQHKDYIENFVPFVITLINRKKYSYIDVNTICTDLNPEFGLRIPYLPMVTIIQRLTTNKYIYRRRSDRKFIPDMMKIAADDFSAVANEQENKYRKIITEFARFCASDYGHRIGEEEAEEIFISFLKEHDLDILYLNAGQDTLLPPVEPISKTNTFLLNSFIKHSYETKSDNFLFLVDISIGHMISNLLVCEAYEKTKYSLEKTNLYLDIGFLFSIFGLNGPERKTAYVECLQELVANKAKLYVFSHTYTEFKSILENSMRWISKRIFDIDKASRTLLFFHENNYKETDIEELILNIDKTLESMLIEKIDPPSATTDTFHNINESLLQEMILSVYKGRDRHLVDQEKEYTVLLDVKSIASIYILRKGGRPQILSNASHALVTTNISLAYAAQLFDSKEYADGNFAIPSTLTDVFVGTLLWANSPHHYEVSVKKLISDSYASLQPTKELLKKLVETTTRLKSEGIISNEDFILLNESRTARSLLQKETLGDPNRFNDKTAIEILEEIKEDIRKEEQERFDQERIEYDKKIDHVTKERTMKDQQLSSINEHLKGLEERKRELDARAIKSAKRRLVGAVFAVGAVWLAVGILIIALGWEMLERWTYFFGLLTFIEYGYLALKQKEVSPIKIYERYLELKKNKNYMKNGFDLSTYNKLKETLYKPFDLQDH